MPKVPSENKASAPEKSPPLQEEAAATSNAKQKDDPNQSPTGGTPNNNDDATNEQGGEKGDATSSLESDTTNNDSKASTTHPSSTSAATAATAAISVHEKLPTYKDQVRDRTITVLPVAKGVPLSLEDGNTQQQAGPVIEAQLLDASGHFVRISNRASETIPVPVTATADVPLGNPETHSNNNNGQKGLRKHLIWASALVIVVIAIVVFLSTRSGSKSPANNGIGGDAKPTVAPTTKTYYWKIR